MKLLLAFSILFTFTTIHGLSQANEQVQDPEFNLNKPEREEWLRDLGFGMFVHWSIDSQLGIVISHSMVGASEDYLQRFINDLPKTFYPDQFSPKKFAELAKLAGMKYVVFTTKHHSGFCMWDTQTTDFDIMNTPYNKDILREFIDALREVGLAVGLYYSPEDFKFLYDNGITINRRNMVFTKEFEAKYEAFIASQCEELFSNYGKIDLFFIDGEPKDPAKYTAWKLQPDVVVTRGAINTPEQTVPGAANDALWESCITMGTQWQYKPTNDDLKSGTRMIEILIETRAKGGNLLLNVGPHPYGNLPDDQERRLREIAAWMFINYKAIENARPWIVTNEENIWFTKSKNGKNVYAYITGIPDWKFGERREFLLRSVRSTEDTKVSVLGQNDKALEYSTEVPDSRFEQREEGLRVSVVRAQRIYNDRKWPNPVVVKLENVEPACDPPAVATGDANVQQGKVSLSGVVGTMGDGKKLKAGFYYRPYAGFVENMYVKEWSQSPMVEINKADDFLVELKGLDPGKTYEYRAVVVHPKITIQGETRQFEVK